mmetsp:Transcript_9873/g.22648  ORF Transcript_9873/g.22648 Transcript_9873/m.22648 type:complete len:216 (+) Transcript_9873:525-1172(+)
MPPGRGRHRGLMSECRSEPGGMRRGRQGVGSVGPFLLLARRRGPRGGDHRHLRPHYQPRKRHDRQIFPALVWRGSWRRPHGCNGNLCSRSPRNHGGNDGHRATRPRHRAHSNRATCQNRRRGALACPRALPRPESPRDRRHVPGAHVAHEFDAGAHQIGAQRLRLQKAPCQVEHARVRQHIFLERLGGPRGAPRRLLRLSHYLRRHGRSSDPVGA